MASRIFIVFSCPRKKSSGELSSVITTAWEIYYFIEYQWHMEKTMFKLTTPTSLPFSTCPPPRWKSSAMKFLAPSMISTCLPPSGTKREPCSGISTTMTHSPKTRCWQWHWLTLNTLPRLMMTGISCSASSAITDRVSIWCSRTRPLSLNSRT